MRASFRFSSTRDSALADTKREISNSPQLHPAAMHRVPTTAPATAPLGERVRVRRAARTTRVARTAPNSARLNRSVTRRWIGVVYGSEVGCTDSHLEITCCGLPVVRLRVAGEQRCELFDEQSGENQKKTTGGRPWAGRREATRQLPNCKGRLPAGCCERSSWPLRALFGKQHSESTPRRSSHPRSELPAAPRIAISW